jgi:hypothetical protein
LLNAYEEGLGNAWQPIQRYWREPTLAHRNAVRAGLNFEGMRHEYSAGIPDPSLIKPESYTLDATLLEQSQSQSDDIHNAMQKNLPPGIKYDVAQK